MAEPKKHGDGWRIQLKINGKRESKKFASKREAVEWYRKRSLEIQEQAEHHSGDSKTLADVLLRYSTEVCPQLKASSNTAARVAALLNDPDLPCTVPLSQLNAGHFHTWKARREREVKGSSVRREMNVLSSALGYARKDWAWIKHSPLADVRRPKPPAHRDTLITWSQIRKMLRAMNYSPLRAPQTKTQLTAAAFLVALQTGMRASEITTLEWRQVKSRVLELPDTKNGSCRHVPIAPRTVRLLNRLRGRGDRVMALEPGSRDSLFRRARDMAGLSGFTFHDSRHTAATRVGATVGQPGRLSFPEFCYVFGWKDPKYAMVYVNPDPERLADKL